MCLTSRKNNMHYLNCPHMLKHSLEMSSSETHRDINQVWGWQMSDLMGCLPIVLLHALSVTPSRSREFTQLVLVSLVSHTTELYSHGTWQNTVWVHPPPLQAVLHKREGLAEEQKVILSLIVLYRSRVAATMFNMQPTLLSRHRKALFMLTYSMSLLLFSPNKVIVLLRSQ